MLVVGQVAPFLARSQVVEFHNLKNHVEILSVYLCKSPIGCFLSSYSLAFKLEIISPYSAPEPENTGIVPRSRRKPREPLDMREHRYSVPEPKEAKGAA